MEQEIAEQRLNQQEKLALREQEFKRQELERKSEMEELTLRQKSEFDRLQLGEEKALKLHQIEHQLALFEQEQQNQRRMFTLQHETLEVERPLHEARLAIEAEKKTHEVQIGQLDLELEKEQIVTANAEDAIHLLYNKLPEIAGALRINEVNLGQDILIRILDALRQVLVSNNPKNGPDDGLR
ncbi:hypothetical protein IH992_33880 [Candidatus Poribacteria bacterium]|nr:hypothetical protein [Candidatus Poribacteria bacterium]